ncbi:MAG TPA: peptide chain release factor-like protein [Polyangia bacterium]
MSVGLVFPVSHEKLSALRSRMLGLGIREDDLQESFVTSQGKGGQNVNKVATCVVLFHAPSGLRIKCQQERSQGLNRYIARKLLADKIEEAKLGAESKRVQEMERIRRQKRRRSRRAKNRMLDDKHARSAVKNLRGKVGRSDD